MHKTKRMVMLLEPDLFADAKRMAKKLSLSVAGVLRLSLKSFLDSQKAIGRGKKLASLAQFKIPLTGIETPEKLNRILEQNHP